MSKSSSIARNLKEAIVTGSDKKDGGFDTTATVNYIEDGVAYVRLPGSEDVTPVDMTLAAKPGDRVQVRVSGGGAFMIGNSTAPPTDDTVAVVASEKATAAIKDAGVAHVAAQSAQQSADAAAVAAGNAQRSANTAAQAAAAAQTSADNAQQSADAAQESADIADQKADEAIESARTANTAANSALTQLATVEDVAGVLEWIKNHGEYTATTDTAVAPGKIYFTRTGSGTEPDPYVYTVVENPTGDPSTQGWYELTGVDEAVSTFVAAHLALTNQGLYVLLDNSGYKVLITNTHVSIINDIGTEVAKYGETAQIGQSDNSHALIDYNSFKMIDRNGSEYANITDLRDGSGIYTAVDAFFSDGATTVYDLAFSPINASDVVVSVDGATVTSGYAVSGKRVTFTTAPSYGVKIEMQYQTRDTITKAYTFGARRSGGTIGGMSFVEGFYNIAAGAFSHAEGSTTEANARASHAEGDQTVANGENSHAEGTGAHANGYGSHAEGIASEANGSYSHVEGYDCHANGDNSHAEGYRTEATAMAAHAEGDITHATGSFSHAEGGETTASNGTAHAEGSGSTASGIASHAEGGGTTASAIYSHSQNHGTKASSNSQTAMGKYNVEDSSGKYALIIGNGTSDSARSNAFAFTWGGRLEIKGATSDSNDYGSPNPQIIFQNSAANQNGALVWTDYDSVQSPASLTLAGNQGGEYFIAPNIKAAIGSNFSSIYGNGTVRIRRTDGNAWVQCENGNGVNAISMNANTDGTVTLWSRTADGSSYTILRRGNNSSAVSTFGEWTFNSTINRGNIKIESSDIVITRTTAAGAFYKVKNTLQEGSLFVSDTGNLGLYSDKSSKWLIYINSSGTVTVNTSDIRYKDVIGAMPTEEATAILREVDVINFIYKDDENRVAQNGVSAQQLRDVLIKHNIGYRPYLSICNTENAETYNDLTKPEDGIQYGIDYGRMVPVLWKGWQVHEDRISALERENEELKAEMKELKDMLHEFIKRGE